MQNKDSPKFGEVYFAELQGGDYIQSGIRPVVVVQNDIGNKHSPTVEVLPLTSKINKAMYMPTHVLVKADNDSGLTRDSVVLAEQCVTIQKSRLEKRIGKLHHPDLVAIGRARRIQSPFPER